MIPGFYFPQYLHEQMRFSLLRLDGIELLFALRLAIIMCFSGSVYNSNAQVTMIWPSKDKFQYYPKDSAEIKIAVGENSYSGYRHIDQNSIQQLVHYTPGGRVVDIASPIADDVQTKIRLSDLEEGTHMVIFHSTNSYEETEAPVFNDFLKNNNCLEAIRYRKSHHEDSIKGKQNFQSSIKTIFQAGNTKSLACTQPTTLPLDIFPNKNVYDCKEDSTISKMTFTVYFKGKPLKNAAVKIGHQTREKKPSFITLQTDKKGRVKTSIKCNGLWSVSTILINRLNVGSKADWQTYSGSVTWGYE